MQRQGSKSLIGIVSLHKGQKPSSNPSSSENHFLCAVHIDFLHLSQ
jgi:hypothetical protein